MPESDLVLILAGLAGGFAAGLIGIGGGIIFAPVLLLYFRSAGVPASMVTPLAIGTSLLCTLLTSAVSARDHHQRHAVRARIAVITGAASAVAVFLTTVLVTTRSWYDQRMFGIAFSIVLLTVAVRMLLERAPAADPDATDELRGRGTKLTRLAATGTAAGIVSSAVGVGGGVVLVPAYNRLMRLPIHASIGTSSMTIIIISVFGVASYVTGGFGLEATPYSIGFVDPVRALYLSVPAAVTARVGVWTAHRINQRRLQQGFALFAIVVSLRILIDSFVG